MCLIEEISMKFHTIQAQLFFASEPEVNFLKKILFSRFALLRIFGQMERANAKDLTV